MYRTRKIRSLAYIRNDNTSRKYYGPRRVGLLDRGRAMFCELRLDRILGSSLLRGCAAHTALYLVTAWGCVLRTSLVWNSPNFVLRGFSELRVAPSLCAGDSYVQIEGL